jgi:ATP-dependent exoDNAse (exonuclease V) beta subunit
MTRTQKRLVAVGARPTGGGLGNSRLGRILAALRLDDMPAAGTVVAIDGLDAAVIGIAAAEDAAEEASRPDRPPVSFLGHEASAACPEFLDLPSSSGAPRRVSFSALAAYQRCPRQFYLERTLGLVLEEEGPGGEDDVHPGPEAALLDEEERHAGREVGLLVHALLERLPLTEAPPPAGELRAAAQEALERSGSHLSPADLDRALALTQAFWDSPLVGLRSAPLAMREAPFFFGQGDILVSGIMDLVCRGDGLWHIVDYKTNALSGRTPAEVAAGYGLQAVVYCLAGLRAGAAEAQMDFLFLEAPRDPVTIRHGRDDISGLEGILGEALAGLQEARFPACAGKACDDCLVARVCANMARS